MRLDSKKLKEETFITIEDISFSVLLEKVSISMLIELVEGILLEREIIIFAKDPTEIVQLIESVISLIKPLKWDWPIISFLPTEMLEYGLDLICAYIIGVSSTHKKRVLNAVKPKFKLIIDLDNDEIIVKDVKKKPS